MNTVIVNQFDGGLAEDVRTFASNQAAYTSTTANYDIYTNPHLLRPHSDPVADTISTGTGVMTDHQITDVLPVDFSGTTKLVGWGRQSSSAVNATFFTKTAPITSAWSAVISDASANTPASGTLIEYKGSAYAINQTPNLVKFTSGTTYTSLGTMGPQNADLFVCKPFVHPEDNILYFAAANQVGKYDGTTFTASGSGLLLPTNVIVTSLTNFGGYLAIGTKPKFGVGKSIVYLWGRDTTLTTVQGIIDWGDGALEILENMGDTLVGISSVKAVGTFDTITNYNYKIKIYSGGSPVVLKDFTITTSNVLRPWKAKQHDKLYFGFDTENSIFVLGRNRSGEWYVSKDRYITPLGSTITGTLNGISAVGDIIFTAYTDGGVAGYLARTSDSTFAVGASYTTTFNPNMPIAHRFEDKQLKSVQIAYQLSSSTGIVGLGYYSEGQLGTDAVLHDVISESKTAAGDYVFTASAHIDGSPFLSGREFQFRVTSVGEVRIKEIKYKYELLNTI